MKLKNSVIVRLPKRTLMRIIILYQQRISRHTCLYEPTCSQYMLESVNNRGVIVGVFLGLLRILRCNPLSHGGYDPASEDPSKVKWLY